MSPMMADHAFTMRAYLISLECAEHEDRRDACKDSIADVWTEALSGRSSALVGRPGQRGEIWYHVGHASGPLSCHFQKSVKTFIIVLGPCAALKVPYVMRLSSLTFKMASLRNLSSRTSNPLYAPLRGSQSRSL